MPTSQALVSVADVFPSLMHALHMPADESLEGESFAPHLLGGTFDRPWVYVGENAQHQAVIESRWKLLYHQGAEHLFDLDADPFENNPLPAVGPDADRLRAILQTI